MICDAKKYQIPNILIMLGYITGLYLNLNQYGAKGMMYFTVELVIPILILFLLFEIGCLGAGDIKLLSVLATMVGVALTMKTFILSVVIASLVIVILCVREKAMIKRKLHYSYYIAAAYYFMQIKEEIIR